MLEETQGTKKCANCDVHLECSQVHPKSADLFQNSVHCRLAELHWESTAAQDKAYPPKQFSE